MEWLPDRRGRLQPLVRQRTPASRQPQRQLPIATDLRFLNTWNNEEKRERGEPVAHNNAVKNLVALYERWKRGRNTHSRPRAPKRGVSPKA